MVMEGDLTWGGEHTIQYTDYVSWNCTSETYITLFFNVSSFNSINKEEMYLAMFMFCKVF